MSDSYQAPLSGEIWTPLWEQDPPEGTRVIVKVRHPNGEFGEDIGMKPFAGEWQLQSFKSSVPVAWMALNRRRSAREGPAMSDTVLRIEIVVADPELAYRKISNDPRGLGVRMREVLGGRDMKTARWSLEHEFGVRVASAMTVFKENS